MAAVEVLELVVRHGSITAVDELTFSADAGRVTALLGPNGAGKTTTVETLEGYHRPDSGRVRVLDLDPVAQRRALVPRIGVMLQRGGVYPGMPAATVLRLFASYYDDAADPDVLLERVGLAAAAGTPWRRLSGGEQQRLSLALALVGRPEVVFLDEPTAGLDPEGRLLVRGIVSQLREEGTCVIITTHELDEAERLADRVVIIDHGRLVAAGTPDELMRSGPTEEFRFTAEPGLDVIGLATRVGAPVVEVGGGDYVVRTPATPAAVAAVTAWLADHDLALGDLRAGRQRLEDVFLRLTGGDEEAT